MDSHRRGNPRSKAAVLLLIVFFQSFSSQVFSEEKVKLTLYYEALCLSCADFIVNYLYKIFDSGLISVVDLKLSPYGNAKISSDGTIICQHGETECLLNTVEACSIHVWPNVSDHFPFIYCVEKLNYKSKYTEWETCFEKTGLDPIPVIDCYSDGTGHELEVQYAYEISTLEPPHDYVPWVVVDGQPLYDDYTDFISFICKAYKGSNTPRACVGFSRPINAPTDTMKPKSKSKSTISEIISSTVASWMTM